ncbi:MAG: asparagine synthase (glutamine-hydrolyzing) [Thermoanaerobaculia bacterium]
MCGIVGVVAREGPLDPEVAAAVPAMAASLRHRGPDGEGTRQSAGAALGHRRLAIIDRAAGQQPMSNEDGSCWIVFNGEIYNHHELRRRLEARGHRFRTRCDTEVIVHAYEEYGTDCPSHLEGMFAFAVYDERRRELFLARDRLGKKPLFYAELGGMLHFASEIKALRQSPVWDGSLDTSALESYFCLGYFVAPKSIFKHVRKLEPGHWLKLGDGRMEVQRYWDVEDFDSDRRQAEEISEELESELRSAVRQRLESEVPLGAFLSSGIDSSLVVSFMHEVLGEEIRTATVGFGDARHNEIPGAGLVARHFNTRHETEIVQPSLEEVFDPLVEAFDEPFADDSAIPTYYVSQMARRHVTVALTGDGGDESFGGYDFRYVPHSLECRLRPWLPGRPGRDLMSWLGTHWPRSAGLPRMLRWGTILENLSVSAEEAYYLDLCFQKPADARLLLGQGGSRDPRESPVFDQVTEPYRKCPSPSPLQRAQYADLKVYLPNAPLVKVDRMSMHHSLEVRSPLLDHRVVEFAFRVPTPTKLPGLECKYLLRQLARTRLPGQLLDFPKRGFSAPVGDWIRGPLKERFREEVLRPEARISSWLDLSTLGVYFDEHCRGLRDRSYPLWASWVLERWSAGWATEPAMSAASRATRQARTGPAG